MEPTRRVVTTTTEWDVKKQDIGLFFIYNAREDLSEQVLTVSDSNGNIVWESQIRSLPADKFNLIGISTEDVYITKQVFSATDIPQTDDYYSATVNQNFEDGVLCLKINNFVEDKFLENTEDFTKLFDIIEQDMHPSSESELVESTIELLDEEVSVDLIRGHTETVNTEGVALVEAPRNFKDEIISTLFSYVPINIDCRDCVTHTEVGQSIMIEKIGSYYIVLLNGFGPKPTYLLEDDEYYFEFLGTVSSFFEKIEKRICKMYGLSIDEYNEIDKFLVVDESEDILEESLINIKVLKRAQLLSEVVNDQDNIILDLTYSAFTVIFKNESGHIIKITNQHLGLVNGEQNIDKIASIIQVYPHENFIFTGLFINDSLYAEVKTTDKVCNQTSITKFIMSK